MNLNFSFLEYCKNKNFEINKNQLKIIDDLNNYYKSNFFIKYKNKRSLQGWFTKRSIYPFFKSFRKSLK